MSIQPSATGITRRSVNEVTRSPWAGVPMFLNMFGSWAVPLKRNTLDPMR